MKAPALNPGGTSALRPRLAGGPLLAKLNLPASKPVDWRARALARFRGLLRERRPLRLYLDTCARCGACADQCPSFLGTGDPKNMPVARAELMRKIHRRYFTPSGRLGCGAELDDDALTDWLTYFYQCTECRRCAVFCPLGVDTAEITMAAREIMASIAIAPKYVAEVINKAHAHGNNLGIPEAAWRDSCEFLEGELKEQTGVNIKIPVNGQGAEVLFVPPSADLFANTDTMMGCAKFFHAAGINWTTSTYASEAGNFGLFLNYEQLKKVNRRIVDSARDLGVRRIVMGECGHAWRAAWAFMNDLNGPLEFLDQPRAEHICQVAAKVVRKNGLRLDKSANAGLSATYHDPCNLARAGNLTEEPREILRAVLDDFREMPADTIRKKTFCCGAGGGLLTDELMELRLNAARPRMEAFRATNANCLATPCAICKAQFPVVFEHYGITAQVAGVMDLLGKAIVI